MVVILGASSAGAGSKPVVTPRVWSPDADQNGSYWCDVVNLDPKKSVSVLIEILNVAGDVEAAASSTIAPGQVTTHSDSSSTALGRYCRVTGSDAKKIRVSMTARNFGLEPLAVVQGQ
jgi:hypothetical protein